MLWWCLPVGDSTRITCCGVGDIWSGVIVIAEQAPSSGIGWILYIVTFCIVGDLGYTVLRIDGTSWE